MLILSLLAVNIAMVGWLYIFFIPPDFQVKASVADIVISGAELPVLVEYHNLGKGIGNVHFELIAPSGFTPNSGLTKQYTSLAEGESGVFSLPGHFMGNVDEQYRFLVLYSYDHYGQHYENFAVVEFLVAASSLEVVSTLPDTILNNESFTWRIEYTNSSDYPRNDSCIRVSIPKSFAIVSSSHALSEDNSTIYLDDIAPRGSGVIEIVGSFSNAIGEGGHVVRVSGVDDCEVRQFVQVNVVSPIQVLTPRLRLNTSGAEVVNVGSSYTYTQSYSNTGDAPLREVHIVAQLQNFSGKYSTISANQGSVAGDVITWIDPEILPGETHYRSFTVTINPSLRQKNAEMSYSVSARAEIDDLGVQTYTPVTTKNVKYNSTLQFSVVQRYSSNLGEQFGYGPYPLEADNITALRVFWDIQDFTNDLTNLTIQTTLPSQVEWTGHAAVTEGAAMTYDPATRTITWHTGQVTSFSHAQGASFEVRVRPNSAQIGKQINVTNDTRFSARDSFTGTVLTRAIGALRTEQAIQPTGE